MVATFSTQRLADEAPFDIRKDRFSQALNAQDKANAMAVYIVSRE